MNLLFVSTFVLSSWLSVQSQYNMEALITCFEQNNMEPYGFRDPIWSDPESAMCQEYPELHEAYMTSEYPGKGDVCDHTDPKTQLVRDSCYFNVNFGPEINEEKTWSYKCWEFSRCPLKDPQTGEPREGCQFTAKRANCCCKDDFCNGSDLIQKIATLGDPLNYPPKWEEICTWDWGETYVLFNVDGYEHCGNHFDVGEGGEYPQEVYPEDEKEEYTQETAEEYANEAEKFAEEAEQYAQQAEQYAESEQQQHSSAHSVVSQSLQSVASDSQPEAASVTAANMMMIAGYFVVGSLCLCVGVLIGHGWKQSVLLQDPYKHQRVPIGNDI